MTPENFTDGRIVTDCFMLCYSLALSVRLPMSHTFGGTSKSLNLGVGLSTLRQILCFNSAGWFATSRRNVHLCLALNIIDMQIILHIVFQINLFIACPQKDTRRLHVCSLTDLLQKRPDFSFVIYRSAQHNSPLELPWLCSPLSFLSFASFLSFSFVCNAMFSFSTLVIVIAYVTQKVYARPLVSQRSLTIVNKIVSPDGFKRS